jgi:hypothetical protein
VNFNGLKISTVSTSGNTVTLTFPSAQYTNLQAIAGTAIVPKAIWSTAGNPATFQDPNPVGTGPYMMGTFTPQGSTLKKNPYYWQAADVQVPAVYFPVYTSNTGALSALFAGQIYWTGTFIPGLQKNFVNTDPAHHGYWEAPGGTNSLMPNLNTWPTNVPHEHHEASVPVVSAEADSSPGSPPASRIQHAGVPGDHPGRRRLAGPPMGLRRRRTAAHRRRAHRPADARRRPGPGQADRDGGRAAGRRGGQLRPKAAKAGKHLVVEEQAPSPFKRSR